MSTAREPFGGRYYGVWNVEGEGEPIALFTSKEDANAELRRRTSSGSGGTASTPTRAPTIHSWPMRSWKRTASMRRIFEPYGRAVFSQGEFP